jgi:hypothetical protein
VCCNTVAHCMSGSITFFIVALQYFSYSGHIFCLFREIFFLYGEVRARETNEANLTSLMNEQRNFACSLMLPVTKLREQTSTRSFFLNIVLKCSTQVE